MKVDMQIVRDILLFVNENDNIKKDEDISLDIPIAVKNYHLTSMETMELIAFKNLTYDKGHYSFEKVELLKEGLLLLDIIEDDIYWSAICKRILDYGMEMSLPTVKMVDDILTKEELEEMEDEELDLDLDVDVDSKSIVFNLPEMKDIENIKFNIDITFKNNKE